MSDLLNDDLLNYELGDDLDDNELYAADEDELLLSEDELDEGVPTDKKVLLKDDVAKEADCKQFASNGNSTDIRIESKKNEEQTSDSEFSFRNREIQSTCPSQTDVSIAEKSSFIDDNNVNGTIDKCVEGNTPALFQNYEISSTIKEPGNSQPEVGKCSQQCRDSFLTENVIHSSQDSSSMATSEASDPTEDPEEREERINIKHTSERASGDFDVSSDPISDRTVPFQHRSHHHRFSHQRRGRGMLAIRGNATGFSGHRAPLLRYPNFTHLPQHVTENVNPQIAIGQFPFSYSQGNSQQSGNSFVSPGNGAPIEYRGQVPHGYRHPETAVEFNAHGPGGQRPNYSALPSRSTSLSYGNCPPPQSQVRPIYLPDIPHRSRMQIPRPVGNLPLQGNQNYMSTPIRHMHTPRGPMPLISGPIVNSQPHPQTQPVITNKILINPNFKGGLQAATSQLMKDTQFIHAIGTHIPHMHSDAELLRQQEEFINKNREHIARRHDKSPHATRSRSRSRDRSYTPPKRDRDRRGGSRDRYSSSRSKFRPSGIKEYKKYIKRRRSLSVEAKPEKTVIEEDEETRAYRVEIEKQKALREKILRDKEMRRRKAAEKNIKPIEDKSSNNETPQKLKPLIVTESKMITLKRKYASELLTVPQSEQQPEQKKNLKTIPTATVFPETRSLLVNDSTAAISIPTNPVVQKNCVTVNKDCTHEDNLAQDEEEDRLLADTPSPPPSPKNSFVSLNRRVVLKTSTGKCSKLENAGDDNKRGIFGRLDKRMLVGDSVKKKINRMTTKNSE